MKLPNHLEFLKHPVWVIAAFLGGLILFALVLVFVYRLAGYFNLKLTGPQAAAQIKRGVLAPKGILHATVTCPAEIDLKTRFLWWSGEIVECSVTFGDSKGTVTAKAVTWCQSDCAYSGQTLGDFEADVDDIQLDVIEQKAQEAQPGLSRVDCPSSSKPRKGATFVCTGELGSGFGVVIVEQTSEDSNVAVRLLRSNLRTRRAAEGAALLERSRRSGSPPAR